jgi:hypothetical protein
VKRRFYSRFGRGGLHCSNAYDAVRMRDAARVGGDPDKPGLLR